MDARQHIIHEAIQEQRFIFGAENPDKAWILSDWDTWEHNPFYSGPPQPHPEYDEPEELPPPPVEIFVSAEILAIGQEENDDIPF